MKTEKYEATTRILHESARRTRRVVAVEVEASTVVSAGSKERVAITT